MQTKHVNVKSKTIKNSHELYLKSIDGIMLWYLKQQRKVVLFFGRHFT